MVEISKEQFLRRAGLFPHCPCCLSRLSEYCPSCGKVMEVELHSDGRILWFCFDCRELLEDRLPID